MRFCCVTIALYLQLISVPGICEELDPHTQAALIQTQELLRNPAALRKAASENPDGQAAMANLEKITQNPETQQQINNLAASVFANFGSALENPEDALKLLNDAQKDPTKFANSFTPEQKAKLNELNQKIAAEHARPLP